jgi:hypothetical protein
MGINDTRGDMSQEISDKLDRMWFELGAVIETAEETGHPVPDHLREEYQALQKEMIMRFGLLIHKMHKAGMFCTWSESTKRGQMVKAVLVKDGMFQFVS